MLPDPRVLFIASFFTAGAFTISALEASGVKAPNEIDAFVAGEAGQSLSILANPWSPHRCFVSGHGNYLSVTLQDNRACPERGEAPPGLGVNRDAVYTFDDMILVVNRGLSRVQVFLNTTTLSGGELTAAVARAGETMREGDYSSRPTGSHGWNLNVGETLFVGLRADTTAVAKREDRLVGDLRVTAVHYAIETTGARR